MQNLSDEERREVLSEVLMDELKAIREYLEDVPIIKQDVTKLKEDMAEVKSDIKVIKVVLADHSRDLDNHETRINSLEVVR